MPTKTSFWTAGRLTGLLLLIVTLTHMVGFQITSRFVHPNDFAATSQAIAEAETLYRLGLLSYSASSLATIGLAIGFFALLAPIHRMLALVVLCSRLFEAVLASSAWAIRFALVDNHIQANPLGPNGALALHQILRGIANAGFDLAAIAMAIANVIGFWLLFKAASLPRILSLIALSGGVVVLISSCLNLGWPHMAPASPLAFAITLLSQLAIGAWLFVFSSRLPEPLPAAHRS